MKPQYGVWRPLEGRLVIKMPYAKDNRQWLKDTLGTRIRPDWNKELKRWEIARSHFGPVVEALANRLGRIDVWMDFKKVERCDTRCRNARSRECTCSCLGKHHGQGVTFGWKVVSDNHTMIQSSGTLRRHIIVTKEEKQLNETPSIQAVLRYLNDVLSSGLIGVVAGLEGSAPLKTWMVRTPGAEIEGKLLVAYDVVKKIHRAECAQTAFNWMCGMNPHLGDKNPALEIGAGNGQEVLAAARAYLNDPMGN